MGQSKPWVKEKVSREIKKYFELSEMEKHKTKMFRRKYKTLWVRQSSQIQPQKKITEKNR